jgi:ABC-type multidrug transport system ATPase subunit
MCVCVCVCECVFVCVFKTFLYIYIFVFLYLCMCVVCFAQVDLVPHADKLSKNLSGGNKRKLSLGNALIGNPKILYVDEASTGVDPMARRKLWDLISSFQSSGNAVILTTHSLEEADALCSRIAIMVSGELHCLGSSQHLKNKFGKGYLVEFNSTPETKSEVISLVSTTLPSATLTEEHGGHMKFEVPLASVSLANIFRTIESNKERLRIREYSVSQPSLEQIFIGFARKENP